MTVSEQLRARISDYHLSKHPFYEAWMKGELSKTQLQTYAQQYYSHVKDFPRFVSATHSQCEDDADRRVLLHNLMEEEGHGYSKNHPDLWRDFAYGVGVSKSQMESYDESPATRELLTTYWDACRSSYGEGLAALYAYEYQVPEVAKLKIDGLKDKYGVTADETLAFFTVHEVTDRLHAQECAELLNKTHDNEKVMEAGTKAAQALWNFLTEIHAHA